MTLKVTSDMVTSLDASKLSGSMPAVDGTSLTNVNVSFADDTNSSDPLLTTNPAGGVGSIWMNNSTGQVFVCTDATTDLNVWTNVGGGTGDIAPFHGWGDTYGYASGGNTGATKKMIDKFAFSSNTTATDHGDITTPPGENGRSMLSGHSSATHGFCSGGYEPSSNIIDKFPFASDSGAVDHGDLSGWKRTAAGSMSTTHGYSSAGASASANPTNSIEKFAFSSNTTATDHGDVSVARNQVCGNTSTDYGFTCGGYPTSDVIDKFAFSSNTTATDHGNLQATNDQPTGNQQSSTYGFTSGGGPSYTNLINKFAFSSNTTAADHGDLSVGRTQASGSSSNTHGFTCGGHNGSNYQNVIDKYAFSSNTTAAAHGVLTTARSLLAGQQS